jgi:hypothetical protein
MMKAYVNQTNTYEGSRVVVEHQDKDQAAGLEIAESFILCIQDSHQEHSRLYSQGRQDRGSTGTIQQQRRRGRPHKTGIWDVIHANKGIYVHEREAEAGQRGNLHQQEGDAHTRLEAIAGADNPYSLIIIFGRGHLAIKAGGAVCHKVLPRRVAAAVPQELQRGDPSDSKQDERLRGPH